MKLILINIIILTSFCSFSQKMLDMQYYSIFGKEKQFQFFTNANFTYKLKGELFYHTKKLVNMQDSILVFSDESVIKLGQLKFIRIDGIRLHITLFGAGVLFVLLDSFNNLINNTQPILRERALMVSGAFFLAAIVMKCIENKHVRIKKNTTLRIIDANFEHLNRK